MAKLSRYWNKQLAAKTCSATFIGITRALLSPFQMAGTSDSNCRQTLRQTADVVRMNKVIIRSNCYSDASQIGPCSKCIYGQAEMHRRQSCRPENDLSGNVSLTDETKESWSGIEPDMNACFLLLTI